MWNNQSVIRYFLFHVTKTWYFKKILQIGD